MIDYQGFLNGEPYEPTPKIENFLFKIGQNALPDEFSEKLTGSVPVQDIEVEVAYPDDHPDGNLKGRNILYKVTLNEIQEEIYLRSMMIWSKAWAGLKRWMMSKNPFGKIWKKESSSVSSMNSVSRYFSICSKI